MFVRGHGHQRDEHAYEGHDYARRVTFADCGLHMSLMTMNEGPSCACEGHRHE